MPVAKSIASKMVGFHFSTSDAEPGSPHTTEALRSDGDLGVVAARAAARQTGALRPAVAPRDRAPASLPTGWKRVWHPTSGRRAGYATFEGPNGETARSITAARNYLAPRSAPPPRRTSAPVAALPVASAIPDNLADHVVFHDRPSTRPPPFHRS